MLQPPQERGNRPQQQSGGRSSSKNQGTGYPNLKTTDASEEKHVALILEARLPDPERNKYDNAVIAQIRFKGVIFLWNLKADNPNYKILVEELGGDEKKWADREVYLFTEKDRFTGQSWLRCEVVKKTTKTNHG